MENQDKILNARETLLNEYRFMKGNVEKHGIENANNFLRDLYRYQYFKIITISEVIGYEYDEEVLEAACFACEVYKELYETKDSTALSDGKVAIDSISRNTVLRYIDGVANSGRGKKMSLEHIRKFVERMAPIQEEISNGNS